MEFDVQRRQLELKKSDFAEWKKAKEGRWLAAVKNEPQKASDGGRGDLKECGHSKDHEG